MNVNDQLLAAFRDCSQAANELIVLQREEIEMQNLEIALLKRTLRHLRIVEPEPDPCQDCDPDMPNCDLCLGC